MPQSQIPTTIISDGGLLKAVKDVNGKEVLATAVDSTGAAATPVLSPTKAVLVNAVATDKIVVPNIPAAGVVIFGTPPTAGMTTTAINALTTTQIAALASACVLTEVINSGSLTTTVINALTPGTIHDEALLLTTTQLQALATTTVQALTTTQLAALTTTGIICQAAPIYGALSKPELPIGSMLVVAPVTGQILTVAVKKK